MTPQLVPASRFQPSLSHLHVDDQMCPSCGQVIPPEKLQEISGKIALREREQALAITMKLDQQHETEKAEAVAKAKADLDLERLQSAAREATAREDAQRAAEILISDKLMEAERTRQELQTGWQKQFEEAEEARKASEQTGDALQAQLHQLREDSAAVLERAKAEAAKREVEIHTEANHAAESAVAERLAAVETARKESETALQTQIEEAESCRIAAQQAGTALLVQLDELQKAREADVAKVKADAAAEAERIRQEAKDAAEAILRDKSEANEKAIAEANAKALEAESKLATLSGQHAAAMVENLNSQREIMEKAKDDAVNIEKAKAFDEAQKLSIKVNDLQRAATRSRKEDERGAWGRRRN